MSRLATFDLTLHRDLALALLDFQYLYGDEWRAVMLKFHNGRGLDHPCRDRAKAKKLASPIRVIRNTIDEMCDELPDLRKVCACCLEADIDFEGWSGCGYCGDCSDCPDSDDCCLVMGDLDAKREEDQHLPGCRHAPLCDWCGERHFGKRDAPTECDPPKDWEG